MDAVSRIDRIEVVALVCCFGLFGLILELVRRKKIKERYSLLWLGLTVSLFFLTIKRDWLTLLSNQLGIFYPPSALFLVLIFFMILILIHFSMVLSQLLHQHQQLIQKISLLETELRETKKESAS
jgi:hypothetical protein